MSLITATLAWSKVDNSLNDLRVPVAECTPSLLIKEPSDRYDPSEVGIPCAAPSAGVNSGILFALNPFSSIRPYNDLSSEFE